MRSVDYKGNTLEDQIIYSLVDRIAMEKGANSILTVTQRDILILRYYESKSTAEIAKKLGYSTSWINQEEQNALKKLKDVILKPRTTVVDSNIGMKEKDWEYLASSIANWLEQQSTNNTLLRKRHGVLRQWAKDIIMWRLTSEERQTLLQYHKIKLDSKKDNQECSNEAHFIHQKIFNLLLEDSIAMEKSNYKPRV